MRVWRSLDEVEGVERSVATIGVFDGVHRGHRHVIAGVVRHAREIGATSVVVTFDPHPMAVVAPERRPPALATLDHRLQLLADERVDAVLVLPFTATRAQQSPEDFVSEVLVEALHAEAVHVGENFRFGHRAAGDVDMLRELGPTYDFEVVPVAAGRRRARIWSSTYVRDRPRRGRRRSRPRRRSVGRTAWRASSSRVTSAAASSATRPPTSAPTTSRSPRRRHLRRLAHARVRRAAARRHLDRHQPDLRRDGPPGRGLRPRPRRPRALRRARGPRLRRAAARDRQASTASSRCWCRWPRTSTGPARSSRDRRSAASSRGPRRPRRWFVDRGLPFFVEGRTIERRTTSSAVARWWCWWSPTSARCCWRCPPTRPGRPGCSTPASGGLLLLLAVWALANLLRHRNARWSGPAGWASWRWRSSSSGRPPSSLALRRDADWALGTLLADLTCCWWWPPPRSSTSARSPAGRWSAPSPSSARCSRWSPGRCRCCCCS